MGSYGPHEIKYTYQLLHEIAKLAQCLYLSVITPQFEFHSLLIIVIDEKLQHH